MKRLFLFCAVIIGLIGAFASCNSPVQDPSTLSSASVWEISKNGNSLFLGGSVHVLRAKDYPMPAAFDSAFGKAAILVLETDVDRMLDAERQSYINDQWMLPEGQTLKTVLDDAVYKQLENTFGDSVISLLSQYKPSVAVNTLQSLYLQQNGFTKNGADLYYLARAKEEGKFIDFLEDIKVQIDMLGGMADSGEDEYVSAFLNALPLTVSEAAAFVSEWKDGTAALIETVLSVQESESSAVYKTAVYDRNAAWMPKIENYLTTEKIEFVIVGLAHVHGHDGLLIQLKNKGYTVKQLVN
ncbi:MAG: TraB/GumN family protein [Spirochaetaceae bacterium]|nr:TraB/GumN family protein [Spirochaetaceae bacterium]